MRDRLCTSVLQVQLHTDEEWDELSRNGLDLNPTKKDEASFDDAVADIYHRLSPTRAAQEAGRISAGR